MQEFSFGIIPLRHCHEGWEVLLIRHRSGNHWSFPKGHAETNESPQTTAIRELKEETGLVVKCFLSEMPFTEMYQVHRREGIREKTVSYFLAEVVDEEITLQKEELSEFRWVLIEDAIQCVTYPEAKALCQQVVEFLKYYRH